MSAQDFEAVDRLIPELTRYTPQPGDQIFPLPGNYLQVMYASNAAERAAVIGGLAMMTLHGTVFERNGEVVLSAWQVHGDSFSPVVQEIG